jgi:hypothetical protein
MAPGESDTFLYINYTTSSYIFVFYIYHTDGSN